MELPILEHVLFGASLMASSKSKVIANFCQYLRHPSEPLRHILDPQDQQRLVDCMEVCATRELSECLDELERIRLAATICLHLSIAACEASVEYVCDALLSKDLTELPRAIQAVPKGKWFRPGQRPFMRGKSGLAQFVIGYDAERGTALAEALL